MNVFPVRDQVVILKHKEEEKKSPAGIILTTVSSSPSRNIEGTVVAVGSGRVAMNGTIVPLEVKVGDVVLFNPNQATEVQTEGSTFLVLREDALIVLR